MAGKDKVVEVAQNTDDKPVDAVETENAVVEGATDVTAENSGAVPPEGAADVVAEDKEVAPVEAAASDDMVSKSDIEKIVNAYLDANLADLVAAAMPVQADPDVSEEEALAKAAADMEADRAAVAEKAAAKVEKERKAAIKARQEAVQAADSAFERAETLPAFTDLATALSENAPGRLLASNGVTYSPDLFEGIEPEIIELVEGRGVVLKKAMVLGAGLPDEFTIHSFDLYLVGAGDGPRNAPLKCPLVSPVTVGGGKNASFAAGSLLFQIVPAAAQ
jgi:hypothetical protein